MEISEKDIKYLHDLVRPILTGEKRLDISQDEKKKILDEYEQELQEISKEHSREYHVELAGYLISYLTEEEQHIIKQMLNENDKDAVQEQYICHRYHMMRSKYDMPEEYVIYMIRILSGAIWWASLNSIPEDVIHELLGTPSTA